MEKINRVTEADGANKKEGGGLVGSITASIKRSFAKTREGAESPIYDAAVFVLAFLFARCHALFGAYPIAIGVIAVLPARVWLAVLGSVTGALTLGKAGIIYSIISAIVAFLRIIISATDKKRADGGERAMFGESLVLRMSCALIGGFIVAVYEVLLNTLTLESALFGAAMIFLPPAVVLGLSGLFGAGISPSAVFLGQSEVFSLSRLGNSERRAMVLFRCSALFGVFLISISVGAYELLGISFGFVFSSIATLFAARRFGTLPGAAVGFASSFGLSGVYSVAFTLVGLVAGALSALEIIPAVILGGAALSCWGGYVGGAIGFLSVFPEYAIAATLAIPLLKRTRLERTAEEVADAESIANDMVGTMALSYKNKYSGALDSLEGSFASVSKLAKDMREVDAKISREELARLSEECINRYFDTEGECIPGAGNAREVFLSKVPVIVSLLCTGRRLEREELNLAPALSLMASGICEAINRAVGIISEEVYRDSARDTSAEELECISKLINEARVNDYAEKSPNEKLKVKTEAALSSLGICGAAVQVYGQRCPHFILAIEDESGGVITSSALKSAIEASTGVKLSTPQFYRKGRMALMECGAKPIFSASSATVSAAMSNEASGDTSRCFESAEGKYFSLISDGMGSGDDAVRTSGFVADFLSRTLEFGRGAETSLCLLNSIIKRRRLECSATVDLFSFDLMSGEATFHKCGAAPSYVKRGSSLYRIRSRTSPIGLCSEPDAERIRVELEVGDMIIMFSDGISADGEAPWLLDTISAKGITEPEPLAEAILTAAKKNGQITDDLSVLVTKIERREA